MALTCAVLLASMATVTAAGPPVAVDDAYITAEDVTLTAATPGVLDNDDLGDTPTTVSFDAISVEFGTVSMNQDGSFTYTPDTNFSGTDSFTYTITDADLEPSTATVTIGVTAVGEALQIVSVTLNDDSPFFDPVNDGAPWTDPDDDGISTDGEPTTVIPGGEIQVTIKENNGTWKATEWVFDNGVDPATFDCVSSKPPGGGPPEHPVYKGSALDPRSATFTIFAPSGTPVGIYDLTIIVHPNANCNGENVDTLTLTGAFGVSNAFDDPYSTDEDTVLIESAPGVLANDTDIDPGYTKIVTEVNGISAYVGVQITLPSGALLKLNADGSFDYDPNGQFESLQLSDSTTDSFTYTILDSLGGSSSAMVTITIDGVNDPPTITSAPVTAATEDLPYSYDVAASDPDLGDTLSFSLDVFPSGMTIDPSSGLISWTPDNTQVGDHDVTVRVEDPALAFDTQDFTISVADVNDPPTITSAPVTAATEDLPYSYDVAASDPDLGDTLSFSLDVFPSGMTIDPSSGLISWTPDNTQVGDHDVTVRVEDPALAFDTQDFTISVADVNDPPTITSAPVTAATEDLPYSYDVEATDPDAGDTLTFSLDPLVPAPTGMTIDPSTGLVSWTPDNDQVGDHAVTVRVEDAALAFDTQSFTISVANVNDAPTITSTAVTSATEDLAYSYDVDATDPDAGDTLTFSLDVFPSGMTIDPSSGLISWTPDNTQVGDHDVTVRVEDPALAFDTQSFTISVADVNDPPTITSAPVTAATEDLPYSYDVEATDPDAGDTLTFSLDPLVPAPTGMTIDPSTGLVSWTPDNDQVGDHAVTVRVEDAALAFDTQSFTISVANVNDAPTITSTAVTSATEDLAYSYDVDATDPDAGDTLTFSLDLAPAGMTIDPSTGLVSWTPDNDQVGDHAVTVRVEDAALAFDTQSFTISVANVNDPPTITSTAVTSATEDLAYSYDVDASDPDAGDTLTFSLDLAPAGMSIDSSTGLISWTPDNDQVGDQDVTVRVEDPALAFDTQSFTVSVANVNDPPTITSTAVTSATEDAPYSYDVTASDPDLGDTLTFSLDLAPAGMSIDSSTGLVSWTPDNSLVGDHAVTVRVEDAALAFDTQSFTITVANVNDAPTITSTAVTSATEDLAYSYDVDASDPDAGDTLTFSLDLAPAGMSIDSSTGLVSWTPDNSLVGDQEVTVRVEDPALAFDTQSFTVSVADVNDPPTITSAPVTTATEDLAYSYDVAASDPDLGDTLTFSLDPLDQAPAGMTIDPGTGLISWTPDNAQVGDQDVTVLVTDAAGAFDTQSITISVANVNDGPTITSEAVTTATEDLPYSYDVAASDPDLGDTLSFSLDVFPSGMTIDPSSGLISWTPDNTQVGDHDVTVRVEDAALAFDTQDFTISVANVNDGPTITSEPVTTATEDLPYSYDVDASDPDAGDTLTFSLDQAPAGMTIDPGTGLISWTPDNAQVGDQDVTVLVTDAAGAFDTQSITISVANVNDGPTITSEAVTTATEDLPYSYDVEASDPDLGDTLTFSLDPLVPAPAGMTIDPSTGLISWTPDNAQVGDQAVTVLVTDAAGAFDTQSFTISVANVNDAPTITSTAVTSATEDLPYSYDVDATDPDAGDTLSFSLDQAPAGMSIDPSTGLISWTPDNSLVGGHDVTVRVTDAALAFDTQSFTISVANVNDGPTITSEPVTTATEDLPYSYDVAASDPDLGDTLSFSLDVFPSGMTIDPSSGLISWTPDNTQVGDHDVTVRVEDAALAFDTQDFTISVANVNDGPVAATIADQSSQDGATGISVDSSTSDVDGDALTYNATGLPAGLRLDSDTGLITGTINSHASRGGLANNGVYTVEVTADDGNDGATPYQFTWTVTAPPPPAVTTSPPSTNTGSSSSSDDDDDDDDDVKPQDPDGDRYNNNGVETQFGSDPDNAASTPVDRDGDGHWNSAEKAAGSDPDNAASTPDDRDGDGYNNVEETRAGSDPDDPTSTPASDTGTIDITAPETTITASPSKFSSDDMPSFGFSSNEGGSTFECQLDGAGFSPCTSPASYPGAVSDGSHTFEVRATDSLGNTDATPASYTWTIDTAAPDTTITASPADPSSDATPSFEFTSTEDGSSFECRLGGADFSACDNPYIDFGPVADGSHTLEVRAIDSLGNTDATSASYTWTIDTTAPDTTITASPADPSSDDTPSFEFISTEDGSSFECRLDGAAFAPCETPLTYSGPVADGSRTFEVRAIDSLGNTDATPASYTWTIDTTAPPTPSSTTAIGGGGSREDTPEESRSGINPGLIAGLVLAALALLAFLILLAKRRRRQEEA